MRLLLLITPTHISTQFSLSPFWLLENNLQYSDFVLFLLFFK